MDENSSHSEEPWVDKNTLSSLARALSPRHSTLVPRHESSLVRGPLASVRMSSTALGLPDSVIRPSSLAAVPLALEMPRTPGRACLALARAMVVQALDRELSSATIALKSCKSAFRSPQCVSSLQAGSCRAHLSSGSSRALRYCE